MFFRSPHSLRPPLVLAKLLFTALVLTGCGGGGSGSTATSSGSFAAGPITGFGSVIVNGIRFEHTAARVTDDDDATHSADELKLGMVVEVDGGQVTTDSLGSHCDARAILFRSEIVGPVNAVDATAKTLVVLGQTVDLTSTTVFDDRLPAGLGSIAVNDVVEVYGRLDTATGHYSATRIAPKPNAAQYLLRGTVSNLDTSLLTFQIGGETISYAGLATNQVPAGLANGMLVRVKLQTTQVAGAWVAVKLKSGVRHVEDRDSVELKGLITDLTSATAFSVDGMAVDATNAKFPDGTTGIVLGARVEVEGTASNGVITATKVSIESEDHDRHVGFELHGAIAILDTSAKTLLLRGITVNYGGAGVVYTKGTESDLAVGRKIEVKGVLSADGTQLDATAITFEN